MTTQWEILTKQCEDSAKAYGDALSALYAFDFHTALLWRAIHDATGRFSLKSIECHLRDEWGQTGMANALTSIIRDLEEVIEHHVEEHVEESKRQQQKVAVESLTSPR